MSDYVIFSIDKADDLHQQAKFLRHIDTFRAMCQLTNGFRMCIGSYKGAMEPSYCMEKADFDRFVRHSSYVAGQESFLVVYGSRAILMYQSKDGEMGMAEELGDMVCAGKERPNADAWTYFLDTGDYWIAQ